MKKIIAALQTSVDGFIEGPNGERHALTLVRAKPFESGKVSLIYDTLS